MIDWNTIYSAMKVQLIEFAKGEMSGRQLYKHAVKIGLGPQVRPLVRSGVDRARTIAKSALRRRNAI